MIYSEAAADSDMQDPDKPMNLQMAEDMLSTGSATEKSTKNFLDDDSPSTDDK